MKILYIGGTGQISFACVHASVRLGHDVHVFNRGNHNDGLPAETTFHVGDMTDDDAYARLADERFDVVCQFRLFEPDHLAREFDTFAGKCGRYVFISSASAYTKPLAHWRVSEDHGIDNPHWLYSRKKAEIERRLAAQDDLPFVIVRPSHTYRTMLPATAVAREIAVSRMLRGKPVVQHGDGTSLWTLTHARDFAEPFARLIVDDRALGEAFHLTQDDAYPWDEITRAVGRAVAVNDPEIVHVPSDTLIRYHPDWEGPLLGDKTGSTLFDNTKIKSIVGDFDCPTSLDEGMKLAAALTRPSAADPYDADLDALMDRIVADQRSLGAAG